MLHCYLYYLKTLYLLYCDFTDVREKAKRKKHKKQRVGSEEVVEDEEEIVTRTIQKLHPKQNVEHLYEDETEILENEPIYFTSTLATDIHDTKIETMPLSEVTHIVPEQQKENVANVRLDATYPIISNIQDTHDKEELLHAKEKPNARKIHETFNQIESLQVTEVEVGSSVDEYQSVQIKPDIKAQAGVVPAETIVTAETLVSMSVADLCKDDKNEEKAKSTIILQDALNVSQEMTSDKEAPLKDLQMSKSFANISVSPFLGVKVTEVNDETREHELLNQSLEKAVTSKLNFNLLESVEVGEVFVEDKSGKYYPELIVPTEMAKKDVLVSNQIITEIHNVQEKEGSLGVFKVPHSQEANIDITSKDSIVVSTKDVHEKEGSLAISDIPVEAKIENDLILHSSLNNFLTTSHVKESELLPETFVEKKAEVGFLEHQHKINIETNVNDSENTFVDKEPILGSKAQISVSALDKNLIEEVQVNESEKELPQKEATQTANASVDIKSIEPFITSETMELSSMSELKTSKTIDNRVATESIVAESAKIISSPFVHDQEVPQFYESKTAENVSITLVPNMSLSVSETKFADSATNLKTNAIPELLSTQPSPTHHLTSPISQVINTADQIDILLPLESNSNIAREERDLHKEVTVLQTTVHEQLEKLDEKLANQTTLKPSFTENESLNIIETVPNYTEDNLIIEETPLNKFAKVDVNINHKVPVISEVTLRESANTLDKLEVKSQEAEVVSDSYLPVQISENKTLETQAILDIPITPDLKSISPHLISVEETLKVSEILSHEKEDRYENIKSITETCKISTDVVARPVAVSAEHIVDLSVGFTEAENVSTRKANVENIALKEITVTTTDYNEKESILIPVEPKTAEALLNVNPNQAVIVEDVKTELTTSALKTQSNAFGTTIIPHTITSEAISQQETLVHSSESILENQEAIAQKEASIVIGSLIVPEHEEKVVAEKEDKLLPVDIPDQHKVNIKIPEFISVETTEVISQCDRLDNSENFDMPDKKALCKVDEIYGKAANIEEILVIQSTANFNETIKTQKPEVKPFEFSNLQQTETIVAESEGVFIEQKALKASVTSNLIEAQAIIASTTNAVEKENQFDSKVPMTKQDALIAIVPHSEIVQSEVIASNNTEGIEENDNKPEMKTLKENIEEQKSINVTEVFSSESETILSEKPKAKSHLLQPTPNIPLLSSIGTTEIVPNEQENILLSVGDTKQENINYNITSSNYVNISEEIVAEKESYLKSEELPVKCTSDISLNTHQHINTEVCQVSEFEEKLKNLDYVSKEIKDFTMDVVKPLLISEIKSEEQSQDLCVVKKIKEEEPSVTVETGDHMDTMEIIPLETGDFFEKTVSEKAGNLSSNVELSRHLTVSEVESSEREQDLEIKSSELPKFIEMSFEAKSSLEVQEIIPTEKESSLSQVFKSKEDKPHLHFDTQQHIIVTDTYAKENEENLDTLNIPLSKEQQTIINTTHHITTSETIAVEDDLKPLKYKEPKGESASKTHVLAESVKKEEQQVIESVEPLKSLSEPQMLTAKKDLPSLKAIENTEIIVQENPDTLKQFAPKEEKGSQSQAIEKDVVLTLMPQVLESTKLISDVYAATKNTVEYDIELQQNYFTQENVVHEASEKLSSLIETPKSAEELIIELKGIEQTEVVTEEKPQDLPNIEKIVNQKAEEIPISSMGINTSEQAVLEDVKQFTGTLKPELSKASLDLDSHVSYTVTENLYEESLMHLPKQELKQLNVKEEILPIKPLEQTEIITNENIEHLPKNLTKEEKVAESEAIEFESINRTEFIVHESEVKTNFKEKIQKENASISVSHLTHLQCTENVSESHVDELKTYSAQAQTPAIKTDNISPLIVTDNVTLHNESDLRITEPVKQKPKTVLNISNELEITDQIPEENIQPYIDVKPKLHEGKIIITENANIASLQEECQIIGK